MFVFDLPDLRSRSNAPLSTPRDYYQRFAKRGSRFQRDYNLRDEVDSDDEGSAALLMFVPDLTELRLRSNVPLSTTIAEQ